MTTAEQYNTPFSYIYWAAKEAGGDGDCLIICKKNAFHTMEKFIIWANAQEIEIAQDKTLSPALICYDRNGLSNQEHWRFISMKDFLKEDIEKLLSFHYNAVML